MGLGSTVAFLRALGNAKLPYRGCGMWRMWMQRLTSLSWFRVREGGGGVRLERLKGSGLGVC